METVAEVPPSVFAAVTVYVAFAATAVGVPEMTPVAGAMLNPAGRLGLTV
jgi:hypothetical protein